jgi:hypothetical protein
MGFVISRSVRLSAYLNSAPSGRILVKFNPSTPELNPSAQRYLPRFLLGILIFKGLTARRVYKAFGIKGLILEISIKQWRLHPNLVKI